MAVKQTASKAWLSLCVSRWKMLSPPQSHNNATFLLHYVKTNTPCLFEGNIQHMMLLNLLCVRTHVDVVLKTVHVSVRVCLWFHCQPSHLEPTTDLAEDQRTRAEIRPASLLELPVTMINERSITIRPAFTTPVPAQNFNPSGSGCSGSWSRSTVRGLESGSNACWIEEDRDAVQVAWSVEVRDRHAKTRTY